MNSNNQEVALAAFTASTAEIDALLAHIIATHNDHFGVDPERGVSTPRRGAVWTHTTVAGMLNRLTRQRTVGGH